MLQPGNAHTLGLHVYKGAESSGADCKHGVQLKKLLREADGDLDFLARKDGRFDPELVIEAGAKYLTSRHSQHKTWERALSAYNQGTPAPNASQTNYVRDIIRLKYDFNATLDAWKKGIVVDAQKEI
jgi:hypothetical protein